jgi:hypothetical protein
MHARVALLSLLLAGPALAAPPQVAPAADPDRIYRLIQGADPSQTPTDTRPVADLVEAAELAAEGLERAAPADLGELLGYVVTARQVAHERTKDPAHLCARLGVVEKLLERPDLPPDVASSAATFRDNERRTLPEGACPLKPEPEPEPEPKPNATTGARQVGPIGPVAPPAADTAARRTHRPDVVVGSVLLALAGASAAALVGVGVYRSDAADKLNQIKADVAAAGGKTDEQLTQARRLVEVGEATQAAVVGLSVALAAFGAVGAGLVIRGKVKQRRGPTVAPLGGPHTAGLILQARF